LRLKKTCMSHQRHRPLRDRVVEGPRQSGPRQSIVPVSLRHVPATVSTMAVEKAHSRTGGRWSSPPKACGTSAREYAAGRGRHRRFARERLQQGRPPGDCTRQAASPQGAQASGQGRALPRQVRQPHRATSRPSPPDVIGPCRLNERSSTVLGILDPAQSRTHPFFITVFKWCCPAVKPR